MVLSSSLDPFQVTISLEKEVYSHNEELILSTSVKNNSPHQAKFCRYHTPFEGMLNHIFDIQKEGESLPYRGIMLKRTPPSEKDWLKVAPGKEIACRVNLSETYTLELPGTYRVKFSGSKISALPDSNGIEFIIQ